MRPEPALLGEIEAAVETPIRETRPVTGGSISPALRVEFHDGTVLFVKTVPAGDPPAMLEAEAYSLERLREASASVGAGIVVPAVMAEGSGWMALEWLEARPAGPADWTRLGHGLALVHDATRAAGLAWGWDHGNYIGPLEQTNSPTGGWAAFWREQRLLPQIRLAEPHLDRDLRLLLERVVDGLDVILGPVAADRPSLLHGDLWNGNVMMTASGPALIDPSSYHGHGEVDLAMAALFGGFDPDFERAYAELRPLRPGLEQRRAVYQLYYLLVHVNLFGAGYLSRTRAAARRALT